METATINIINTVTCVALLFYVAGSLGKLIAEIKMLVPRAKALDEMTGLLDKKIKQMNEKYGIAEHGHTAPLKTEGRG